MSQLLTIAWREPDCTSVDRIPLDWFTVNGTQHELVHDVFEPRSRETRAHYSEAMCDVRCSGSRAELDFEVSKKIKEFNSKNEMYLGVMRITFSDAERTHPHYVEWKGEFGEEKGRVDVFKKVRVEMNLGDDLIDDLAEIQKAKVSKMALIKARLGQGKYRDEVMERWAGACAVTGTKVNEVLRASHIKPWSQSTNKEKLDSNNGLLLSANVDALFDRYLITFKNNGEMLVSDLVPTSEREKMRLELPCAIRKSLNDKQKSYLAHHRERFRNH